jgi:dTDP-glucose 4,6-dehydratase
MNNNNKKICMITGCAGFIGSHLTKRCLDMGWYVYGVDKLSYCSYPNLMKEFKNDYPQQFKFEHIDINDIKHLPELDVVFNICAESHVDNSIENSNEFLKSNISGVHNLLELIRRKKIQPLFYQMSTDEVYGDVVGIGSHVETDNYNPSNPYSFSKASADLLVKSFARTYGIKYKIGRATNTWGIRQNTEKLIPKTCKNLLLNKKIPLHNNGTPIRTWLHVDDCVNGILTIVEYGNTNEIYNIGGNLEIENRIIVAKIANLFGIKTDTDTDMNKICDFTFHRPGQDCRYSLDDSKLQGLGWRPVKEFDVELPNVVNFYKSNFIW